MNLKEAFVPSHPASPGQKPAPSLRTIGAEDAARLAMCNPEDSETAAEGGSIGMFMGAHQWPAAIVLAFAAALTWLIG
jgi:hypothetical protein